MDLFLNIGLHFRHTLILENKKKSTDCTTLYNILKIIIPKSVHE